jgi:hypothetical protein
VTVCVAAICDAATTPVVVGVSDRMLTAGDVQFEPEQGKIRFLTNSIVVMLSGDSAIQEDILQGASAEVVSRVTANPEAWLRVSDAADIYSRHSSAERLKRAEIAILAPLGLTHDSFIARQKEMSPGLVKQLAGELQNFKAPLASAIIAGIDPAGAHLYIVSNADIACRDGVGFASIGAGRWHAESQFMFAGHVKHRPLPRTMLLAYSAKKRAEVAPGVGEGTDMVLIGPTLGNHVNVADRVLGKLQEIYQKTREGEREAARQSDETMTKYVEDIFAGATKQDQKASPGAENEPTN